MTTPKTPEQIRLQDWLQEHTASGTSWVEVPASALLALLREAEEKDLSGEEVRKRLTDLIRAAEEPRQ